MSATSIEWTDFSVNPIRARYAGSAGNGHYCEKVSPGCTHCYSSRLQPRFGMPVFETQRRGGVEPYLHTKVFDEVLRRRKPTKWFWCDMTDMFGSWVPDEWIDQCFAVMALTPQHTHQVLTKRPERMRAYLDVRSPEDLLTRWADAAITIRPLGDGDDATEEAASRYEDVFASDWPLPNVWLGVSVEDQQRADERIPLLLQTPAAVRFLSIEPMLGSVDLRRWLSDIDRSALPVPGGSRLVHGEAGRDDLAECGVSRRRCSDDDLDRFTPRRVQHFSGGGLSESDVPSPGREAPGGCASDCLDALQQASDPGADGDQSQGRGQGEPASLKFGTGHAVRECSPCDPSPRQTEEGTGRRGERPGQGYRTAGDGDQGALGDSRALPTGDCGAIRTDTERGLSDHQAPELEARSLIHWVIVGGESGPGARPFHVDWARSIVEQCRTAGVACFVKQLGSRPIHPQPPNDAGWSTVPHMRDRKGGDPSEWPAELRVREFPEVRS